MTYKQLEKALKEVMKCNGSEQMVIVISIISADAIHKFNEEKKKK
jgi:hypothetical protein